MQVNMLSTHIEEKEQKVSLKDKTFNISKMLVPVAHAKERKLKR